MKAEPCIEARGYSLYGEDFGPQSRHLDFTREIMVPRFSQLFIAKQFSAKPATIDLYD